MQVAVKHVNRDTVVLEILDPFPVHRRVGILDADVDFLDPGRNDPLGTAELRVVAATRGARFQRGEEDRAIELLVALLPFQQRVLRVVAVAQLPR